MELQQDLLVKQNMTLTKAVKLTSMARKTTKRSQGILGANQKMAEYFTLLHFFLGGYTILRFYSTILEQHAPCSRASFCLDLLIIHCMTRYLWFIVLNDLHNDPYIHLLK